MSAPPSRAGGLDTYDLETWLWLPIRRPAIFAFFSDATNLQRLTPPVLRFTVLTPAPIEMRAGARIEYRLRLRGVPLRWTTGITNWDPPDRFVDTQLRGPYREWTHTHTFEGQDEGTLVRDHVRYALPGPRPLARIVNALLVAPDTRAIFEFRHEALTDIFRSHGQGRAGPVTIRRSG
jgi:ligand-binding SRPBCC domain-containing protein